MPRFTKAEIARAIRDARRHIARKVEPAPPRREKLPSELAMARIAAQWMKSSGLDLKALDALRKQRRRELDDIIPKRTADAAKRWATRIEEVQAESLAELRRFPAAVPKGDFFPLGLLALDTPVDLAMTDDALVEDQKIEPQKSFAKIMVDRRKGGFDQVSFVFLFRNDLDVAYLYDFLAVHSASGHANVWVDGNFSFGYGIDVGEATLDLKVEIVPGSQTAESFQALEIQAGALDGPVYWEDGSADRTFAHGGFLTASGVILQPGQTAVVLVSVVVTSRIDDGHLVVDMSRGKFGFRCPAVLVVPKRPLLQFAGQSGLIFA